MVLRNDLPNSYHKLVISFVIEVDPKWGLGTKNRYNIQLVIILMDRYHVYHIDDTIVHIKEIRIYS